MPEITEIVRMNATRVDAVKNPANGFPILLMKAVNAQGGIDEAPDIDGAEHTLQMLAKLIVSEAQEMAVGHFDEIYDIQLLCEAACLIRRFKCCEEMGAEDDGEPIMKDLAVSEVEEAARYLVKRAVSAEERRNLASEGHALSDGSYPIANGEDLHNAAVLARSGHGDVAAAKKLIAKRARELGVPNPLSKETMSDTETTETPNVPEQDAETPDFITKSAVDELVKSAIAEATKASEDRVKAVEAELAKVKATPIPGGPVMTAPTSFSTEARKSQLAEASRFERLAENVNDIDLQNYYKSRAAAMRAGLGV